MNLKLNLTSAGGLLALLDEPQSQVQGYALEKLNDVVDVFWAEIADKIKEIEVGEMASGKLAMKAKPLETTNLILFHSHFPFHSEL